MHMAWIIFSKSIKERKGLTFGSQLKETGFDNSIYVFIEFKNHPRFFAKFFTIIQMAEISTEGGAKVRGSEKLHSVSFRLREISAMHNLMSYRQSNKAFRGCVASFWGASKCVSHLHMGTYKWGKKVLDLEWTLGGRYMWEKLCLLNKPMKSRLSKE